MFIAIGFPSVKNEAGAEIVYLGLVRSEMQEAVAEATAEKRFNRIGILNRPLFQKVSLEAPRFEATDCSVEHNAGLTAERAQLALGTSAEDAALHGATVKLNGILVALPKAEAAAKLADDAVKVFPKTLATNQQKAAHRTAKDLAKKRATEAAAVKSRLAAATADHATKTADAEIAWLVRAEGNEGPHEGSTDGTGEAPHPDPLPAGEGNEEPATPRKKKEKK